MEMVLVMAWVLLCGILLHLAYVFRSRGGFAERVVSLIVGIPGVEEKHLLLWALTGYLMVFLAAVFLVLGR